MMKSIMNFKNLNIVKDATKYVFENDYQEIQAVSFDDAEKAMDEWVKELAVGFGEYLLHATGHNNKMFDEYLEYLKTKSNEQQH